MEIRKLFGLLRGICGCFRGLKRGWWPGRAGAGLLGEGGDASCGVCGTMGFLSEELIETTHPNRMQIKTILNRVQKHQSFVYGEVRLHEERGRLTLDVELRGRANGRPKCSGCARPRPGYDTMAPRRFEFVPPAHGAPPWADAPGRTGARAADPPARRIQYSHVSTAT